LQPHDLVMILAQLTGGIALILALAWLLRKFRKRQGDTPIHPLWGILAIALGAIAIALAWTPTYTREIAPILGARLRDVGLATMLLPLAWWWINSVRLLRLCCGYSAARTARIATVLLIAWAGMLVFFVVTAHAIYLVIMLLLVRG
jgi:hypothetical protein